MNHLRASSRVGAFRNSSRYSGSRYNLHSSSIRYLGSSRSTVKPQAATSSVRMSYASAVSTLLASSLPCAPGQCCRVLGLDHSLELDSNMENATAVLLHFSASLEVTLGIPYELIPKSIPTTTDGLWIECSVGTTAVRLELSLVATLTPFPSHFLRIEEGTRGSWTLFWGFCGSGGLGGSVVESEVGVEEFSACTLIVALSLRSTTTSSVEWMGELDSFFNFAFLW